MLLKLQARGRVHTGPCCYGVPRVVSYAHDNTRLLIGSYTSVALRATFILGVNHPLDRVTSFRVRVMRNLPGAGTDGYPSSKGDIHVGPDVWIGYGALVLSGVTIGDGSVVAANSVVISDIPPYAIVAGNPAKLIRYRDTPEQRSALLEIAWWNWPGTDALPST